MATVVDMAAVWVVATAEADTEVTAVGDMEAMAEEADMAVGDMEAMVEVDMEVTAEVDTDDTTK